LKTTKSMKDNISKCSTTTDNTASNANFTDKKQTSFRKMSTRSTAKSSPF